MTIRKQTGGVAVALVLVFLMGWFPIAAQEPPLAKATPIARPVRKKQDPSRRVPAYFGQIGLTTEQRASIYSIQSKRFEKIEAMEKQIALEKAEMLNESESVLNETQRKLLDNLRKAAAEPAPKSARLAEPATPSS